MDLVHPKSNLMDLAIEIGDLAESSIRYVAQEEGTTITNMADHLPMFFYVSALKKDGVDDLRDFLLDRATPTFQEWEVDAQRGTNLEPLEQVEEVIREKALPVPPPRSPS